MLVYNLLMDDDQFMKFIDEAVESLPREFLDRMENVSIVMEDYPNNLQMEKVQLRGEGGLLLGLYEGVPQTKRGRYGIGPTLPDKITIFKIPLMMVSKTPDELKEKVRDTVIHEIGHHFGMNEEQIRDAMKK